MRKPKQLYGHDVCKKCVNAFANRRQIAWIIDLFLIRVAILATTFAIGMVIGSWLIAREGQISDAAVAVLTMVDLAFVFVGMVLLAMKDGFYGYSPGKMLLGVKVIDEVTGQPIGFGKSLQRNWPAIIPFMPIVMGCQLLKGKRAGDGMAKTRVVWNRYASNPVFGGDLLPVVDLAAENHFAPPIEAAALHNPYQSPQH
jgi:uncharacterized RDD family membrane protein YckC